MHTSLLILTNMYIILLFQKDNIQKFKNKVKEESNFFNFEFFFDSFTPPLSLGWHKIIVLRITPVLWHQIMLSKLKDVYFY